MIQECQFPGKTVCPEVPCNANVEQTLKVTNPPGVVHHASAGGFVAQALDDAHRYGEGGHHDDPPDTALHRKAWWGGLSTPPPLLEKIPSAPKVPKENLT